MFNENGRVVFLIELKPGAQQAFREAYGQIRYGGAQTVAGRLVDQVCKLRGDDGTWLITSEWESLKRLYKWERSSDHRELARSLRDRIAGALHCARGGSAGDLLISAESAR